MKVRELIKMLQSHDQELEVMFDDNANEFLTGITHVGQTCAHPFTEGFYSETVLDNIVVLTGSVDCPFMKLDLMKSQGEIRAMIRASRRGKK